jgi:hypothetical protein
MLTCLTTARSTGGASLADIDEGNECSAVSSAVVLMHRTAKPGPTVPDGLLLMHDTIRNYEVRACRKRSSLAQVPSDDAQQSENKKESIAA